MTNLTYVSPNTVVPNRDRDKKDCKIIKETIISTCISKNLRKFIYNNCEAVYESMTYNTLVYDIKEIIQIAESSPDRTDMLMEELNKIKEYDYLEV